MTTNLSEKIELVSQPEVCRRLGIGPLTIHRWRKRPELGLPKVIKIGDRCFFRRDEFESWLEARVKGAA